MKNKQNEEQWVITEISEQLEFKYLIRKKRDGNDEFLAILSDTDEPKNEILRFDKSDHTNYHYHLFDDKTRHDIGKINTIIEQISAVTEILDNVDNYATLPQDKLTKIINSQNILIAAMKNLMKKSNEPRNFNSTNCSVHVQPLSLSASVNTPQTSAIANNKKTLDGANMEH